MNNKELRRLLGVGVGTMAQRLRIYKDPFESESDLIILSRRAKTICVNIPVTDDDRHGNNVHCQVTHVAELEQKLRTLA